MTTVKLEKFIQAPPSEVYQYLTNSTDLRDWLCDVATVDARPGGRLYMWWNSDYYTSGEYLEVKPNEAASFTWHGRGEPHPTHVSVSLRKKKGGTLVKLAHRKLGKSQNWATISTEYEKQWAKGLDNLASVLESGTDLRITTRPMLGIYPDELSPAMAQKLGVPVTHGVRLIGVLEGMSAHKAGLQADDVITTLDEQEVTSLASFRSHIRDKHTGDSLAVTYYRCADKRTVPMTLTGRKIPSIPADGRALATQLEPAYQRCEEEIGKLLNDASQEECARKPAPSDWSANETLAHLIHSELGWQNIIGEILTGYQGAYDGWGGNFQAHVEATVSTFNSKDELFAQYKNHVAETFNLLRNIPAEFISHKGRWWKLVFQAHDNPPHIREHIEQIRSIIKSARQK